MLQHDKIFDFFSVMKNEEEKSVKPLYTIVNRLYTFMGYFKP